MLENQTSLNLVSRKRDSNPRPTHYECVALPTEPFRLNAVQKYKLFSIATNLFLSFMLKSLYLFAFQFFKYHGCCANGDDIARFNTHLLF